jgi:SAM-dependent methyltransferase
MNPFGDYCKYYDLLYKDKVYDAEAGFVDEIIKKHLSEPTTILEFGCGTGFHASKLASKGYQVHGVDSSDQMLEEAQKNLIDLNPKLVSQVSFSLGDIRHLQICDRFDVVIALFHVISYLTSNEDIKSTFDCAKFHLKKGGIFLFDCWYGPAVLTERPEVRIKRVENDKVKLTRIAEPRMIENSNIVSIDYQMFIKNKLNGNLEIIKERHRLRYLFKPEVAYLLNESGFELLEAAEWMTGKKMGFNSWYVYFVAKA